VTSTLTPQQDTLKQRVTEAFQSTQGLHQRHENKWTHYYSLWRGYTDWKDSRQRGTPRDLDEGLRAAKREWGAELFIPLVFAVIETQVPRLLAQRPRMNILPTDKVAVNNVENMKFLVDRQQEQIDYELLLQPTAKDGLMYGLGVSKDGWKTEKRKGAPYLASAEKLGKTVTPEMAQAGVNHFIDKRDELLFDDPYVASVDPFDFFWDPFATGLDDAEWVLHRTWRSTRYVVEQFKSGRWGGTARYPGGEFELPKLTAEDIQGLGGRSNYDEAWSGRKKAAGHEAPKAAATVHEVWECHYRDHVCVILDRQFPVACGQNPYWHGEFPFSIYRPTEAPHEFVGVGEVEPIESLQEEMNTLRSQRRDAATMALNKPFAYYEGLVDPADLKWGPNTGIPVNGDPRELLHQLDFGDVPGSSFQDAAEIQADIYRTAGLSEGTLTGQPDDAGQGETATGRQIIQLNMNQRVALKTKRLDKEVIARQARHFGLMNQQKIVSTRDMVYPKPPEPGGYGAAQAWAWRQLGPDELAGTFRFVPEGESTAPENVPQKRQDARDKFNLLGQNPHVDQRALLMDVASDLGYANVEAMMLPEKPGVPPAVLDKLADAFGQDQVEAAVQAAQQEDPLAQPPQAEQLPQGAPAEPVTA
jgi:hypothetical protein